MRESEYFFSAFPTSFATIEPNKLLKIIMPLKRKATYYSILLKIFGAYVPTLYIKYYIIIFLLCNFFCLCFFYFLFYSIVFYSTLVAYSKCSFTLHNTRYTRRIILYLYYISAAGRVFKKFNRIQTSKPFVHCAIEIMAI